MASSPPNCPNCLVVGLLFDKLHIAFCMLDDYISWNMIQACNSNLEVVFVDIELVQERCYVLTETLYGRMSFIMIYDLQSHQFSPPEATILFKFEPEMQFSSEVRITTRIDATHFYFKNYLFHYLASNQSNRDLYLIFVVADIVVDFQNCDDWSILEKLSKPPVEREFIIYKIVIGNNHARLVKVQDLNGGVLFLSNKANKMVPSSALISGPKSLVKENNIVSVRDYRCMDHPYLGTQIAIFSMDSNKTMYVPLLEWGRRGIPASSPLLDFNAPLSSYHLPFPFPPSSKSTRPLVSPQVIVATVASTTFASLIRTSSLPLLHHHHSMSSPYIGCCSLHLHL
ncbi:hypothetical protein PIB30_080401 [Stylosanthes scabra]|uniref:Uncharacterized protein n=1 Tax=Stylosanthes scabra TaxID=79078 RepID=A0ABU6QRJ2_9FABA|nr:hypothetical protein [Stylosanthes scabra]